MRRRLAPARPQRSCGQHSGSPGSPDRRMTVPSGPASVGSPSAWRARATTSSLTRYDEKGWRATFYTTGMEHSPTSVTGTGWGRTPVAYDAVNRVGRQLVPADKECRSAILAWFAILR